MDELLIDVTRLLGRLVFKGRLPTGIDRVDLEYLRHFSVRPGARAVVRFGGRSVELPAAASRRVFAELLMPRPRRSAALLLALVPAFLWPVRQGSGAQRLLLNTGHSGLDDTGYDAGLARHRARPLFFVHDLIPITHPEYCRAGEADKHARRMDTVLRLGAGVITNSQATLNTLAAYAGQRGHRLPPSAVALLGSARLAADVAAAPPFTVPYFVMLGTIEPRKNHWLILHLWRQLVEQFGSQAPRLVVVGQRGWECQNVVALLDRCSTLRGYVIERTDLSDAALATCLKHARALLFPSFTEGYGLPLVEALGLGVPVIASDLAVFRELAGEVPDYLNALDGPAWLSRILDFAAPDSRARADQLARMAGYEPPTWAAHFTVVEYLMHRLVQEEAADGTA